MTVRWDPAQYLRYADERERPWWDLVARLPTGERAAVVDLGCGPGTLTATLAERWPGASVTGIDSSPEMIGRAAPLARPGRLEFRLGDAAGWTPGPGGVDVIVSNAALQWIPGHERLLAGWVRGLRRGGALAFQVPGNFDAPSHTLLRDLAGSPRWRDRLAGVAARPATHDPADYLRILRPLGATVDAWETTYLHLLHGPAPVLEWVRGTALRPYLSELGGHEADEFVAEYAAQLALAYPPEPGGGTILDFRRMFVVATVEG